MTAFVRDLSEVLPALDGRDWCDVRPSAGRGQGAFAVRPIPPRTLVADYPGHLYSPGSAYDEDPHRIYCFTAHPDGSRGRKYLDPGEAQRGRGHVIDGKFKGAVAPFINEPSGWERANACFLDTRRAMPDGALPLLPCLWALAPRGIPAGAEVLARYGRMARSYTPADRHPEETAEGLALKAYVEAHNEALLAMQAMRLRLAAAERDCLVCDVAGAKRLQARLSELTSCLEQVMRPAAPPEAAAAVGPNRAPAAAMPAGPSQAGPSCRMPPPPAVPLPASQRAPDRRAVNLPPAAAPAGGPTQAAAAAAAAGSSPPAAVARRSRVLDPAARLVAEFEGQVEEGVVRCILQDQASVSMARAILTGLVQQPPAAKRARRGGGAGGALDAGPPAPAVTRGVAGATQPTPAVVRSRPLGAPGSASPRAAGRRSSPVDVHTPDEAGPTQPSASASDAGGRSASASAQASPRGPYASKGAPADATAGALQALFPAVERGLIRVLLADMGGDADEVKAILRRMAHQEKYAVGCGGGSSSAKKRGQGGGGREVAAGARGAGSAPIEKTRTPGDGRAGPGAGTGGGDSD